MAFIYFLIRKKKNYAGEFFFPSPDFLAAGLQPPQMHTVSIITATVLFKHVLDEIVRSFRVHSSFLPQVLGVLSIFLKGWSFRRPDLMRSLAFPIIGNPRISVYQCTQDAKGHWSIEPLMGVDPAVTPPPPPQRPKPSWQPSRSHTP